MALNAGDIVFKLLGDDSQLRKVLGGVRQNLGKATRAIGAGMTAAGGAITGFAAVSITKFAAFGDQIDKMSQRTGFSTEALSELKFAAEQSGTSIDGLERATRNLSQRIVDASTGNTGYQESLQALGLTYQELMGLSPEEQFMKVGMALADLDNHTVKAAMAGELFGRRMGTQLLPLLNQGADGIAALREEARRLGFSLSEEQAKAGATFNDTLQKMNMALGSVSMEVADVLIPDLIKLMTWVKETAISFREWRKENPELVGSITKLTAAAGVVMTVLGPILVMLPGLATAFAAVKAAVLAVGAAFTAIAAAIGAPVAVVVAAVAAIIAAAVALWYYWDEVKYGLKAAWEFIANAFMTIWGPIIDAIKWIGSVGLGVLDRVGGMFGSSGMGGVNQAALDRYRSGGGNALASTAAGGGGGGGGMGGVMIQNMTVVSSNPEHASRNLAEQLHRELSGMGLTT